MKERYQHLFEVIPHGIEEIDTEGNILAANPAYHRMLGYSAGELVGMNRGDLIPEEDRARIMSHLRTLAAGHPEPSPYKHEFATKDGRTIEAEIAWDYKRDAEGKAVGFISAITACKQRVEESKESHRDPASQVREYAEKLAGANRELQREIARREEAEQSYHALVDNSVQGLEIFQDGRFVYVSRRLSELTGFTKEELLGYSPEEIHALVHPEDQAMVWGRNRDRLAGKSVPNFYEFRVIRKDGTVFWGELAAALITYKGKPALQIAIYDITGRKAMTDALKRTTRELEQSKRALEAERVQLERRVLERTADLRLAKEEAESASRAKSQFLSNMSHELRTPLNGVLGFAELLQQEFFGPLNEKQREFALQIERSGRHLLDLINDLLDIAKIEAGRIELRAEIISPDVLINDVRAAVSPLVEAKHLALTTSIEPELGSFCVDSRRFQQVMLNLLSNAIKFTPEHGAIAIHLGAHGAAFARITVTDSGIGIPPDQLAQIFAEFHQTDAVRDAVLGGTGIGLALAKRLVELQGGEIGVSSSLGQGSAFYFTVPRTQAESPQVSGGPAASRRAPTMQERGRKILIVDDNEMNIQFLATFLGANEHCITVAHNGKEAMDAIEMARPDLVLTDICMPVLDGMAMARLLRAIPQFATLPIIAVTANADPSSFRMYTDAGINDVFTKPLNLWALAQTVDRHLRMAAAEQSE